VPWSYLPPLRHPVRAIGRRTFDFRSEIVVMGVVNRTPDSFYDRGRTFLFQAAVDAALDAAESGAGWVDIGGMPFSPYTPDVDPVQEIERVVPVVAAVVAASDVVVSVDTSRAQVAAAALRAGASVINDTSGLADPELAAVVADSGATLIVTHSAAGARRPVPRPSYDDVVAEVKRFLVERVELAVERGVPEDRIVIDPGHDLNKNTLHSLELTRRLAEIADLGLPMLVAVSNKDFVGEATGLDPGERSEASLATAVACALAGARILRMHGVVAAVRTAAMVEAILGLRCPAHLRHNI